MGTCVTKHHRLNVVTRQDAKQRTTSTQRPSGISPLSISTVKNEGQELPSPTAGRKTHAVTVTTAAVSKQNIPNTNSGYADKHVPQAMNADLPTDASAYKKVNNQNAVDYKEQAINDISEIKNIQHKSVFLKATGNQAEDDDPIARIVRLEEACIRLKARLEKEKIKSLAKAKPKYSSHHQFGQNTEFFNDNDARCFATIIKLADFVQEKSQRLWEDPHDMEVQDALASLEYASKMLQLDCLIDFQRDVAMALPPDSPIRQNHKHLLRAQSQQPPSEKQQPSDPQLMPGDDGISPPQPVLKKIQSQQPPQTQQITFLQLYPVVSQQNNPSSSDGTKKSTQHYLSPSQPQHSPQQEDEPVNDPELEILAPETKCQNQLFLPCNPSPDVVKKLSNATLPQTNTLNPGTISDPTLKQSNLAPKAPPQNQHSAFGSPVSPLVLDCQQ